MTQTRLMTQLPMTRLDLQIVVVPAIEGNRGVDAHPGISPPDARSGIIIAGCPRWMDQKKARTLSIISTYHPHNGLQEDKMTEFYDTVCYQEYNIETITEKGNIIIIGADTNTPLGNSKRITRRLKDFDNRLPAQKIRHFLFRRTQLQSSA